ncbi:MAG: autotransporter-associated beta strand repeat-containing protein, partial [Planctomycetota bacterium]
MVLQNNAGSPVILSLGNNQVAGVQTTYSGTLSGPGGITKSNLGFGNLLLTAANTYSGTTSTGGGTLILGNDAAIGTGRLVLNAGTLDVDAARTLVNNNPISLAANSTFQGSNTLNTGTGAFTLGGANYQLSVTASPLTIGGVIGDAGLGYGFTKWDAGNLILAAANTYSGTTTISQGTLVLGNDAALGTGRLVLLGPGTLDVTASRTLSANNAQTWNGYVTFKGSNNLNMGTGAVLLGVSGDTMDVTSSTLTVGGGISDAGLGYGIAKAGVGTLVLNGSSTYSGTTTLSAGTLVLGNASAVGTGRLVISAGSLDASTPLTLATNNPQTWSTFGFIGSNPLNLGTGAVTLAAALTATVNSNTLTAGGTIAGAGFTITKAGTGTLVLNGNVNTTLGGVTVSAGQLTLGGSNSYLGATTVSAGTLLLANQYAVQNSTVTASAGTSLLFDNSVSGNAFSFGNLVNSTTIALQNNAGSPAPVYLTVGGTSFAAAISSGVFTGSGGITKTGSGSFTLSGANTYSGTTTLASGTLSLGNATALGTGRLVVTGGVLDVSAATTISNNVQSWNGDFIYAGANTLNLGTGSVTLGATRTLTVNGANALTVNGAIGDSGSGYGLVKAGFNMLILGGSSTYTGATTVNAGTLRLDFGQTSAPATNILATTSSLVLGGGTFNLTGKASTTNSQTVAGLTLNPGASAISLTNQSTANPLLLSVGAITRNVGSTVDFTNPANLAIGGTNGFATSTASTNGILGGWATVGGASWATTSGTVSGIVTALAPASYTASLSGTTTPGSTANVDFQATNSTAWNSQSVNSVRFNTATAGALSMAAGQTLTVSSGGILVTTNVAANATSITGGTLLGAAGADLVVIQNNASGGLTIASTIADNSSATGLTKSGAGNLTLNGANTYSGQTTLNSGTLTLGNDVALGTGRLAINGGVLDATANRLTTNNNLQSWNGDFTFLGTNTLNLGTGGVTLGNLTLGGSRTVTVTANTLTVGGAIGDGSQAYGLTKAGAGTLVLGGANTYTGQTTLSLGTLNLSNASALQNSTLSYAAGLLVFDSTVSSNAFTIGALSGATNFALQNNAGSPAAVYLSVGGNNATTTYSGVLSGAGGITKTGSGSFTLSGANLNTGTTTLSSGTLFLGNATATGTNNRLVINGGTLDVTAAITLANTTVHSWNGDFTYGGSFGLTLGTGTVALGATPTITVAGNPATGQYGSLTVGGGISGPFGLTKAGPSMLVLNGSNTFTGNLTLASGTLQYGSASGLGTGTTTISGNAVLQAGTTLTTLNNVAINAGVTGTFDSQANSPTWSGVIGGAGRLAKVGSLGTLTLTASNSYSGGTWVNNGTLVSGTDYALGSGPISLNTPLVPAGYSTLKVMTTNGLRSSVNNTPLAITMAPGSALWLSNTTSGTFSNNITTTGTGTIYIVPGPASGGTANNTLGNLTTGGDETVYLGPGGGGTVSYASTTTFGTVLLGGNLTFSGTQNAVFGAVSQTGGSRSLSKLGASTLTLSASSSYSGGTYISGGTLVAGTDYALGSGPVFISDNFGSTATLTANSANFLRSSLTNAPLDLTMAPGATLLLSSGTASANFGNNIATTAAPGTVTFYSTPGVVGTTYTLGNLVVNGTQTLAANSSSTGTLAFGTVTLAANTTIDQPIAAASGNWALGPVGETGGSRSLTKLSGGTLIFTGSNTYTGTTTIS